MQVVKELSIIENVLLTATSAELTVIRLGEILVTVWSKGKCI